MKAKSRAILRKKRERVVSDNGVSTENKFRNAVLIQMDDSRLSTKPAVTQILAFSTSPLVRFTDTHSFVS